MTLTRKQVEGLLRIQRISESVRSKGIKVTHCRNLDRMTNIETCWGGHLKNATCHYTNRIEWTGNTYPIRHILKAAGFRWDAGKKAWWIKATDAYDRGIDSTELSCQILRELGNGSIEETTRRITNCRQSAA